MPVSTVFSIEPVYSVISSDPSVSGAAGAEDVAADTGADGGGNAQVTFSKGAYSTGAHGGPVADYANSVTLPATVTMEGQPVPLGEGRGYEERPLATQLFKVSTDVDPGVALGAPLVTDDLMVWAGLNLFVVGTAIPQGTGYLTTGRLIT